MKNTKCASKSGFTLIELLVVVAIIALLISILLPSLQRAREQTRSTVCLSNLRSMGQGVYLYATSYLTLPGPLHPAVYRNQGVDYLMDNEIFRFSRQDAEYQQTRFLTHQLKAIYRDSSTRKDSISDSVATCPTLAGVVPDDWFVRYSRANPARYCFPTHYVINNAEPTDAGTTEPGTGRCPTDPPMYFGLSPYQRPDQRSEALKARMAQFPPRPLEQVKQPAREWMVADAWYRKRTGAASFLEQEGTYQYDWSGTGMINYAPHGVFRGTFDILNVDERSSSNSQIRKGKMDGKTNTVFFDSHAEPVTSKTLYAGRFDLLYGFPCTVNPLYEFPSGAYWE